MATATGKKVAVAAAAALLLGGTTAVVVPAISRSQTRAPAGARLVSVPPDPLSVTTRGGVLVEFLGVSNATRGLPWWDGNGAPAATQPFTGRDWPRNNTGGYMNGYDPDQQFEFAVRARYITPAPHRDGIFLQPAFDPHVDRQAWETPQEITPPQAGGAGLARIQVAWARPVPARCRMTIGVASGPWQTVFESATPLTRTEFAPRPDKPKLKIILRPLQLEDASDNPSYAASSRPARPSPAPTTSPTYSRLIISTPMDLWSYQVDRPEIRFVAVVDGKEIPSEGRMSTQIGRNWEETLAFKSPPEKVRAIRFQVRRYEPVVFENISLRPGGKTDPKVTLKQAGEPLAPLRVPARGR